MDHVAEKTAGAGPGSKADAHDQRSLNPDPSSTSPIRLSGRAEVTGQPDPEDGHPPRRNPPEPSLFVTFCVRHL